MTTPKPGRATPRQLDMRTAGEVPHRRSPRAVARDATQSKNGAVKADSNGEVDSIGDALGRVLTLRDLESLPPPEPMIEGMLSHRSAVLMVGATGSNKTFAAVGMGCSVATGVPWLGHRVAVKGHVIFVVGEGAHGLAGRVAAWKEANHTGLRADAVTFVLKPASLTDPAFWEALTRLAKEKGAVLVILDTLSSLAPDADETKDAATIVRHLSDLSMDIDGSAMLVHHTGWGPQNRARGGSQFESNADEVLVLEKVDPENPNTVISIKRKKVKEQESGAVTHVRRKLVGASAVLEVVDKDTEPKASGAAQTRERVKREIMRNLEADPYEYTKTDMRQEVKGKGDIFNEVWDDLVNREWIVSKRDRKEDDTRAQTYWAAAPVEDMT